LVYAGSILRGIEVLVNAMHSGRLPYRLGFQHNRYSHMRNSQDRAIAQNAFHLPKPR